MSADGSRDLPKRPAADEDVFRTIFARCPLPMWIYRISDLRFVEVNEAAIERYGYSREEFLGLTLLDVRPPEDRERLLARIRNLPSRVVSTTPWRHRRKDGQLMEVEIHARDIAFRGEPARIAQMIDVSARRETERQLLQAQKMEAMGQLTGGVAHDFNNILMVLMAQIDAMEEEDLVGPRLRERLASMGRATQRASDLTRRLLAFSRKQSLRPQPTNLNELVSATGRLLRRTLGENIEIESVLSDDLWTINVDRGQLEAALVNLCLNSRDAMPGGGELLIETHNVTLGRKEVAQHPDVGPGDYVMLAVTDAGTGIPAEALGHVFEPFFTTKAIGKGTGLGLSMVYGFIKQSQGHVTIDSELGRGTTVKMYLPRAVARPAEPGDRAASSLPHGSERILVVEDNADVRLSVTEQLRSLGYRVTEAASSAAALAELAGAREPYHLLLSDMVMPGPLNGKGLAEQVGQSWPDVRVLLMSGHSEHAPPHDRPDGSKMIAKPFRKSDLAQAVREMLDQSGP
jgi:PAS domain S-box-containing protein